MSLPDNPQNLPVSREDWLDHLGFQNHLRSTMLSRRASYYDPRELVALDCERLAIFATIADDLPNAAAAAFEAAGAGAAAVLATALSGGEVVIEWPDGTIRRIPVSAPPLGPMQWTHALACALIARDQASIEILCHPAHINAAIPEDVDAFWLFFCAAVAALVQQPEEVEAWLRRAEPLLAPEKITRGDPKAIHAHAASLVPLLRALSSRTDWETAFSNAIVAFHRYYEAEGLSGDPLRLLPITITGLAALASDRGIPAHGLPEALVRGEFARASLKVSFEYASRFAERESDPVGFLDLEGFPPSNRKHVLGTRADGQLVARYQLSRNGVPHAAIEFLLAESDPRPGMPPALDPGERILLAQLYAEHDNPASLNDAIDQIDAVLAIIPPGADAVPQSAFMNPRGQSTYRDEPGRFRRNRLMAYRSSLQARPGSSAKSSAESPHPAAPHETQTYLEAMAAAEVVKQGLHPLLDALRNDRTGRIVARLRPRAEDYLNVFEPDVADSARSACEAVWDKGIAVQVNPAQTETLIAVAPAGMLRGENELSRHFPGGYRTIAQSLNPRRVWAAWKYVEPGKSSGMAYDGLVWCDDHWAWFPKIYRLLGSRP